MAQLNVSSLLKSMLAAAKPHLSNAWNDVRAYARIEFKRTAETLALIGRLYATGKISKERAAAYVRMQRGSVRNVLMTIEGIGLLAAEQAINAALDAVKAPVNAAVGFSLL